MGQQQYLPDNPLRKVNTTVLIKRARDTVRNIPVYRNFVAAGSYGLLWGSESLEAYKN